jgi:hypothetical protein
VKIFMSWSGEKSRAFAEQLKPWLEQVLPGTDVWLSSEDIDKGTIWFTEIIGELERCNCGVICRDNHLAPWIHFEPGGITSRRMESLKESSGKPDERWFCGSITRAVRVAPVIVGRTRHSISSARQRVQTQLIA